MGQSAIDVPLDRIVIVPRLLENEEDGYSPVGMAAGKRVFRGGSSIDRTITFEAGATKTVVLLYLPKPELWWVDEYALSWR